MHLRPAEGQRHQRALPQLVEGGVEEAHRGQVPPLEILEHQQHGLRRALGAEEREEGPAHLLAELHRIRPLGLVGERSAHQLPQEGGHAVDVDAEVPAHAVAELLPAGCERLAVEDAGDAAERPREQAEGRAGAHRVALGVPDLQGLAARLELAQELVDEARLPHAGGRGDEHGAGHPLLDALVEERLDLEQLALAADARGRLAEERPLPVGRAQLAPQAQQPGLAVDVEGRAEQARGDVVDANPPLGAAGGLGVPPIATGHRRGLDAEHLDRAIDEVARGQAGPEELAPREAEQLAPGDDDDARPVQLRAQRQGAARRARDQIRRGVRAGEEDQVRAVRERLQPAAVPLGHGADAPVAPAGPREERRLGAAVGAARHHQAHHPPLDAGELDGGAGGHRHHAAGAWLHVREVVDDGLERVRHLDPVARAVVARLGEHAGDENRPARAGRWAAARAGAAARPRRP